jgi:hypothetical protein
VAEGEAHPPDLFVLEQDHTFALLFKKN